MASSADLSVVTTTPASADPPPSSPQPDPPAVFVATPSSTQSPTPPPPTSIPSENVEPSDMHEVIVTEAVLKTPLPISQHPPTQLESLAIADPAAQDGSSSRRRGRRKVGAEEVGEFLPPEQFPDWIPKDWKVLKRPRPTGPIVDTYYLEPSKNRQLRSKKEVLAFLAEGGPSKTPKRGSKKNGAANALHSENPEPMNSESIPEKVTWVYTDSADHSWTPFIGEKRVPEHIRLEWNAKLNPLAPANGDSTA